LTIASTCGIAVAAQTIPANTFRHMTSVCLFVCHVRDPWLNRSMHVDAI